MIPVVIPITTVANHQVMLSPMQNYRQGKDTHIQKTWRNLTRDNQQAVVVYFKRNAYRPSNASWMHPFPFKKQSCLTVSGYADQSGTAITNFQISEKRARFVAKQLKNQGYRLCRLLANGAVLSHAPNVMDRKVVITEEPCQ